VQDTENGNAPVASLRKDAGESAYHWYSRAYAWGATYGANPVNPLSATTWAELLADDTTAQAAGINTAGTQVEQALAPPTDVGIATKQPLGVVATVQNFISQYEAPIAIGATALGLAGIAAGVVHHRKSGKRRKPSHRRSAGRGRRKASGARKARRGRKLKFGSPAWRKRYMRKAGSSKRRSSKSRNRRGGAVKDRYDGHKVLRTKRGQPYIILANGKARFVRA